ncbi:MAG: hypothetical protein Q9O62_06055, partial [Ardenticatenia bacterium]|nr:hypothetical protein [Ardenticatenia bacterium]
AGQIHAALLASRRTACQNPLQPSLCCGTPRRIRVRSRLVAAEVDIQRCWAYASLSDKKSTPQPPMAARQTSPNGPQTFAGE